MAAETFTVKATGDWSSGGQTTWNEDFGGGHDFPIAGDTVNIDDAFTVTIGTTPAAAAQVNLTAGVLGADGTLALSNGLLLDGGTLSVVTVTHIVIGTGDLSFDSGTLSFQGDFDLTGDFDLGGGTINTNGNDLIVTDGDITYSSGSVTELNLRTIGTCALDWTPGSSGDGVNKLAVVSGTTTATANTRINAGGTDFIDVQGTLSGGVLLIAISTTSRTNSTRFVCSNNCSFFFTPDETLTITGEFDIGDMLVRANAATTGGTLVLSCACASTGAITFGSNGGDRPSEVSVFGTLKCNGISHLGIPSAGTSDLTLNSCFLETTGNIDGSNLTITNDANAVHIVGVGGPSITDAAFGTANAFAHECTDGGGANANIVFDTDPTAQGYPNQNMMMGIG